MSGPQMTKALGVGAQSLQEAGKTNHDFTEVNTITNRISQQISAAITLVESNLRDGMQIRSMLEAAA